MDKVASLTEQINKAAAKLRTKKHKKPIKVRIHPLDMQLFEKKYGLNGDSQVTKNATLLGTPLEIDCAVKRGKPIVEYKE